MLAEGRWWIRSAFLLLPDPAGTVMSLLGASQIPLSRRIPPGAIAKQNEPGWDGGTCSGPVGGPYRMGQLSSVFLPKIIYVNVLSAICLVLFACVLVFLKYRRVREGVDRRNRSCPISDWGTGSCNRGVLKCLHFLFS